MVRDLDQDGEEEALLLMRTDDDLWGWPEYRVGFLRQENGLQLQELGPVFSNLGKGNRPAGFTLPIFGRPGVGDYLSPPGV